ncbi:diacylglycerol kinase family protein [Oceanobacillus halotolerans]|uniref:diacylglycerol kinase family protein n=1 Tax=Oceanobacillus halotolerans TaxID=2663380 RepID=UPI001CF7C706|nr:diacylglycerol kinase family protein [Oceanobacillus halotolerans]
MNDKDKKTKKGFGFSYAIEGLITMSKTERNFQVHLIMATLAVITGFYTGITRLEWALLVFAIGLVLIVEIVNTAIEKLIDYLKPEIHPIAKFIKDISAASVLLAAITAIFIGIFLFGPKLLHLFL